MTNYLYGLCSVCDKQLEDDEELHTDEDGQDCHADCCPVCNPPCCVCGQRPGTVKVELVRSDTDPEYADVCKECAAKHSVGCIEAHQLAVWYEMDWPDYCRKCGGWGGHYYPGNYWTPPDYAPCATCVEEGRCPRCNHLHDEDWEGEICEVCNWHYDQDGILEAECRCGEPEDDWWQDEPFLYNDLPDHD